MRYQSLLLSGLFLSLISLPIPASAQSKNSDNYGQHTNLALTQQLNPQIVRAYARISDGLEGKNINQIFAYASPEYRWIDADGNTRNLQQAIQTTSGFFQVTSNIKYRRKVESISYRGQFATVSGTAYTGGFERPANNSYSREIKFQDTWQRNGNGWKWINQHDLSQNIAWATPKPQTNPVGQSQYDGGRAASMIQNAVDRCYGQKDLTECNKLDRIQSNLASECFQNNQQSCQLLNLTNSLISNAMMVNSAQDVFK
jgi:hypothetical protein